MPETRRELDESSSPQVYLPLLLFRSFRTASATETNITEYGPSAGYTSKYLRPAGRPTICVGFGLAEAGRPKVLFGSAGIPNLDAMPFVECQSEMTTLTDTN